VWFSVKFLDIIKIDHNPGCHCRICCRCIQIGELTWFYPEKDSYGWNLNHSCNPKCGIKDNKIIAIKNISKKEEITIDYSTTNNDMAWQMLCQCKSYNCRKIIKSIRYLPSKLYEKYKEFMPKYIKEHYLKTNPSAESHT